MKISYVVALTRAGILGKNNALPWHLPEDLRRFKQLTLGKAILMGRKTYESIGRPLPGRRNVVLSRNSKLKIQGVDCVRNFSQALKLVEGCKELCIIGGAEIFKMTENEVNFLHVTWIEKEFDGDVIFNPSFPWSKFKQISSESHFNFEIPYSYVDYQKCDFTPGDEDAPL